MSQPALIAGGGIGGLAAALCIARTGYKVRLFERAPAFSEVGAGIQLGPNATRLLQAWGLGEGLAQLAAFPEQLTVRSAPDGAELGRLHLGPACLERYGAPYATLHRSDLHALLLQGIAKTGAVQLSLDSSVAGYTESAGGIILKTATGQVAQNVQDVQGDVLIGADGLWSRIRQQFLANTLVNNGQQPAQPTGHLAYRALVPQLSLPSKLRSQQVTVWLGSRLHVVSYPVRGGDWLNVVVIVHGKPPGDVQDWDQKGVALDVHNALAGTCPELQELVRAVEGWRLWVLCDSPPLRKPEQMAGGRIALLGDAAHAMRPYLAQGAGMALEDAAELGRCLDLKNTSRLDAPSALRRYALNRWQRSARVQARALRNGRIFHATGPVRWGRNLALRLLGERLLDMPWLYKGT